MHLKFGRRQRLFFELKIRVGARNLLTGEKFRDPVHIPVNFAHSLTEVFVVTIIKCHRNCVCRPSPEIFFSKTWFIKNFPQNVPEKIR